MARSLRFLASVLVATLAYPAYAGQRVIPIRVLDVDDAEVDATQTVSTVSNADGSCEYRLEFDDPLRGATQPVGLDSACVGPGRFFTTGRTTNLRIFEEQTAYYWVMEAREYAMRRLWVTPPGWAGPPIKHSKSRVDPYVLSEGGIDTACWPRPTAGCMRAFPHEGPRLYLRAGRVSPELVAHEFGHYAAGYVFGHMDTFGFNPADCAARSFQEAIAEMFMSLMLHDKRGAYYSATEPLIRGVPNSSFPLGSSHVWTGQCGVTDYVMGRPLVQAFHKSLWDPVWRNVSVANWGMADAFSYALARNRGHRIEDLARDIVDYVERRQPRHVAARIAGVFAAHGFRALEDFCTENIQCAGPRTSRCDAALDRCIPDDGLGLDGDFCTHNNHCSNRNCVGVTRYHGGQCMPAGGIGDRCETNAGCSSARTSRCDDTVLPSRCIPDDGRGRSGEYCTHNNHCDARLNLVCRVRPGPSPQPGRCGR